MRYDAYEKYRNDSIEQVKEERNKIIEELEKKEQEEKEKEEQKKENINNSGNENTAENSGEETKGDDSAKVDKLFEDQRKLIEKIKKKQKQDITAVIESQIQREITEKQNAIKEKKNKNKWN